LLTMNGMKCMGSSKLPLLTMSGMKCMGSSKLPLLTMSGGGEDSVSPWLFRAAKARTVRCRLSGEAADE
jgi:hypothetical protein